MKIRLFIITGLILFLNCQLFSFKYDNVIYRNNIKTVLFFKKGFEMGLPVMELKNAVGLTLSFDDLDADAKGYKFTIIHCESDWTKSDQLTEHDYIDGYPEDRIENFSYSVNTLIPYTHFSLDFPAGNLKPKISGNYLLVVYTDNPNDPVFTRRFMVTERTALGITAEVHPSNSPENRFTKQEVDFSVKYNGMQIYEPFLQIKVVVTQNDRWDNALRNIKPKFVRNDGLDYNYDDVIIFNGGNEFRQFDIKSLKYQTERIRHIDKESDTIKVILLDDEKRTFKKYASEKDINGRKLIKNEDSPENTDTEADYVDVIFNLPFDMYRANGDMYILGALTDWQLDANSRMDYDFDTKSYTKQLLLKQGFYNYEYVFLDKTTGKADESLVEGSHYETENEYTVWLYYRETGGNYDRLVAVQNLNTIH